MGQAVDHFMLLGSPLQDGCLLSLKREDLTQLPAGGTGERETTAIPTNYLFPSTLPALFLCPLTSPACLKQKGQHLFLPQGAAYCT